MKRAPYLVCIVAVGLALAYPTARALAPYDRTVRLPATFTLRDSEARYIGPLIRSRRGVFSVSLGESQGGNPGFEGAPKGEQFELTLYIYRKGGDPNAPSWPYTRVTMAEGRNRVSLRTISRQRSVTFHGVTFDITARRLSSTYGTGRNVFVVRAHR